MMRETLANYKNFQTVVRSTLGRDSCIQTSLIF
jgi:hypothetical protein